MMKNAGLLMAVAGLTFCAGIAIAEMTPQTGREPQFAYWLDANAPGTLHQDINVGDKPIEVMVVELESEK